MGTDDKWKNSIRHNLSLYPEFVKGTKTQASAGHLWHLNHTLIKEVKEPDYQPRPRAPVMTPSESDYERPYQAELRSQVPSELQRTAEEILAGVGRPTQVEGNELLTGSHQHTSCLLMEEWGGGFLHHLWPEGQENCWAREN